VLTACARGSCCFHLELRFRNRQRGSDFHSPLLPA
jgi:hypothetical protein